MTNWQAVMIAVGAA